MTTQTQFSTGKAELLAVMCPDIAKGVVSINNSAESSGARLNFINEENRYVGPQIKLPPGTWLPIGFLKDITEEQAREIVPLYTENLYKDYTKEPEVTDSGVKVYGFQEALKSLHSLLQSKQVYTENPHGEEPRSSNYPAMQMDTSPAAREEFSEDYNRWQEAEQHVFRNAVVLVKDKEVKE